MAELEQTPVEVAEVTFVHDLMGHCIDEFKAMPEVWDRLSENAQDEVIERLHKGVMAVTRHAVDLLAAQGFARVRVEVGDITIKDAEIVPKITINKAQAGAHDVYEFQGETCYLVLSDAEFLANTPHAHKGDNPQREMELKEEGAEAGAESPTPSLPPQEDPAPAETSEGVDDAEEITGFMPGVDFGASADRVEAENAAEAPPIEGDDIMAGEELVDDAPVTLENLPVDQAHCERVVVELTAKGPYGYPVALELVAAAAVGDQDAIGEIEDNLVDDAEELLAPFFKVAGIDRSIDLGQLE